VGPVGLLLLQTTDFKKMCAHARYFVQFYAAQYVIKVPILF
jgi:hypothetical protein